MSKKRKKYVHSEAFLTKKYFQRVRKEYGDDIADMIAADWAAEVAQAKKAQLVERANAAKAWQAKNPGKALPKKFTKRMKYTNLPSALEFEEEYYYYIKLIMDKQAVSKDAAEAIYSEIPGDTSLEDEEEFNDAAENVLKGRRTEFYNRATGAGDPFRSTEQIQYEDISDLANRLLLTDYWDLAEAAADGRYLEALQYNKAYIEKIMADANQMIDTIEQMQKKREDMLRDPNLSDADAAVINSDYAKDAALIRELTDKLRDLQKLLNYQIRGMKRDELRKMRQKLGVE